jgi:spore maturation protein SpmB
MITLIKFALTLICFISTAVIVIDAFKAAFLKGALCIVRGFYYIFYALFEFKHDSKLLIVLCSFLSGGVAGAMQLVLH